MNEVAEKKGTEEKQSGSKLEAYLQGPRKKRKNYVVLALGEGLDKSIGAGIEGYIKKSYPALALSTAKNPDELTRQFNRNISLLIISDQFIDRDAVMGMVRTMKEKRRDESIPVLFLTKDQEALIHSYHKELFLYRESDEYMVYPHSTLPQIFARIKTGIDAKNHRKSRRYPVSLPITYYSLNNDAHAEGRMIDLSLHGALLTADKSTIFRLGDQIKISIPISGLLHIDSGDFIKISGRVRRVFISGHQIAISFEHATEKQTALIGQLLLSIVGKNFQMQTNRLKTQPPPRST